MHERRSEPSPTEEGGLINRVKAGERELFGQLIDPYARKMYILAYSVLRDEHDAEDAVQESALKAFMRLDQLRSKGAFKCWLMQITLNEARMRKRHSRRYPTCSIDEEDAGSMERSHIIPELVDYRENPEQALGRKELEAAVDCACNDLPRKYLEVFQMRCAGDLTISEIGAAFNLGVPAIKTRLHRARLYLRSQLGSILTNVAHSASETRPS